MDNMWIAIVVVGLAASFSFSNWIRAKHGYPVENEDGTIAHKTDDKRLDQLLAENTALKTKLANMEERMRTLEKIATDPSRRLEDEIARL
jgi:cell division protein FtsB